jgi:hypothetical protein
VDEYGFQHHPLLPPYDLNATDVASVFPISEMVGTGVFKKIKPEKPLVDALRDLKNLRKLSKHLQETKVVSEFVLCRVKNVGPKLGEVVDFQRTLMYYLFLLRLLRGPRKLTKEKLKKLAEESHIATSVLPSLIERFFQKNPKGSHASYQRTRELDTRLVNYLVIVALMTGNFWMDRDGLAALEQDLQIGKDQLRFFVLFFFFGCS